MGQLTTKSWLDANPESLPSWQQEAYHQFGAWLADPENKYPCIPGRQGYLSDNLRFGFAADARTEQAATDVSQLLTEYGDCSRETGKYASLVVFFDTPQEMRSAYNITDYEQTFWSLLSRVSAVDQTPWPEAIAQDPTDPTWEFCYAGHPYFVFCSTPAHEIRKSRQSSGFLMAFQPRWVFEQINDSTPFGRNMKKLIREKLVAYDGVPAHPSLKWYGQSDNLEWKQYFLRDDNSAPAQCPFTAMKNKFRALGAKFHS